LTAFLPHDNVDDNDDNEHKTNIIKNKHW